jgi:aminoglycoside 6'-N-acetyltransferase
MRLKDFPLARRWLLEPHVRRWWHDDPKEADYPEGTLRDWAQAIRGEDPTDMFLIQIDGRPIGVLQSYRVQDYPDYVAELGELAETAASLDLFIGEPGLVGMGHGPALIREFLLRLAFERYGVSYCVIGPARANVAAIRAYEKAGFRYLRDYREPDTTDPDHVLLDIRRSDIP